MKKHELKILPQYFQAVWSGIKTFELRKDDRDYQRGDILVLREWDGEKYTGSAICVKVTYIIHPDGKVFADLEGSWREYKAVPVPPHGRLLNVIKTERECVSRGCDRNCGKCELSLEQSEILSAYDTLISMLSDPAEEGET